MVVVAVGAVVAVLAVLAVVVVVAILAVLAVLALRAPGVSEACSSRDFPFTVARSTLRVWAQWHDAAFIDKEWRDSALTRPPLGLDLRQHYPVLHSHACSV